MSVQHCPHCGLNAWIKADRVCPSCHIHLDAPVTAEDRARIVRIEKRPGPRPIVVAGSAAGAGFPALFLTKMAVGVIAGVVGILVDLLGR